MKRIYVYIIATVLTIAFVVGDYYYGLSMENVVDVNEFETERYLDTSDLDEEIKNFVNTGEPEEEPETIVYEEDAEIEDISNFAKGDTVALTIQNSQNDTKTVTYKYKIQISDASGAYRYDYNGLEKYAVFSASGETEITVNSNEAITIYGLPKDKTYVIEQLGGDTKKYTIKVNDAVGTKTSGILSKDSIIVFSNNVSVKEETNKTNPYTADPSVLAIILFIITTIIFIAIRYIKINRYE